MRIGGSHKVRWTIACVLAVVVACGGTTKRDAAAPSNDGAGTGSDGSTEAGLGVAESADVGAAADAPPACGSWSSTTLPGVRIEFATQRCSRTLEEAASGLRIDYFVVVEEDLDGVQPVPQDEGECDGPGPSGLILFEELRGDGQRYCRCDEGLCPGSVQEWIKLRRGRYPAAFEWDGRNWSGPSDTDAVKGAPFPAGRFTLVVSAVGTWRDGERAVDFRVIGSFELNLVEGSL